VPPRKSSGRGNLPIWNLIAAPPVQHQQRNGWLFLMRVFPASAVGCRCDLRLVTLIGRKIWAIPEGYIPGKSHGPAPEMVSHEACCILNASEKKAQIAITIFFEDRAPAGPYHFEVAPRRTKHLRFNDFDQPKKIPPDTPYSSLIESDVPIVVQHTRLDSRQAENALLTTIAFPCD
jgi:hypothetical protein